jgi:hypothetical protein
MENVVTWETNWGWALPLIVVTITVHVVGLGLVNAWIARKVHTIRSRRTFRVMFVSIMGGTSFIATALLAFEAGLWAAVYRGLNAMPTIRTAILYSLNAFTAYGHTTLDLPDKWRLLGALEALNGLLLFGLTTAFLFSAIQRMLMADYLREGRIRDHS